MAQVQKQKILETNHLKKFLDLLGEPLDIKAIGVSPDFTLSSKYGRKIGIAHIILNKPSKANDRLEIVKATGIGLDPIGEIKEAIRTKEMQYHDYKEKCDNCWLLVVIDRPNPPEELEFTDSIFDNHFPSLFDRVFLLDYVMQNYFELQTGWRPRKSFVEHTV